RARALERADRHDEALACASAALALRPWHVPAVHMVVDLHQAALEINAARQLLTASLEHVQSSSIAWELGCLEQEQGELEAAARAFDRFEQLAPIMEEPWRRALSMHRSDLAYRPGRWPEAAQHARAAGTPFYAQFAARIEQAGAEARQRAVLPITFVRQHHLTCGPAALAGLVRFFGSSTQQAEIVSQIWYGGTFD